MKLDTSRPNEDPAPNLTRPRIWVSPTSGSGLAVETGRLGARESRFVIRAHESRVGVVALARVRLAW